MPKDACLLEWLLYGNSNLVPDDTPGRVEPTDSRAAGWIDFFVGETEPTGNLLLLDGFDPLRLQATRVEVVYEVEVETYATPEGPYHSGSDATRRVTLTVSVKLY